LKVSFSVFNGVVIELKKPIGILAFAKKRRVDPPIKRHIIKNVLTINKNFLEFILYLITH
jgi:hypothetical protein